MKRKIVLAGLSTLSLLTLASCNNGKVAEGELTYTPNTDYIYEDLPNYKAPDNYLGDVDIYINYKGESGITFRGTSWNNTIDGLTYTQGSRYALVNPIIDKINNEDPEIKMLTINFQNPVYPL